MRDAAHYAVYLIPAYGVALLVAVGAAAQTLASARRWRRRAEAGAEAEPGEP